MVHYRVAEYDQLYKQLTFIQVHLHIKQVLHQHFLGRGEGVSKKSTV